MGRKPKKWIALGIGGVTVFALGIFLSAAVSEFVSAHGGDGGKVHVCLNQSNGLMLRVSRTIAAIFLQNGFLTTGPSRGHLARLVKAQCLRVQ